MLNLIWISFFLLGAAAAVYQVVWLHQYEVLNDMMDAVFSMSKTGFDIAIGLTGVMAFWLGIMKVGEAAGMVNMMSRLIAPFFSRLFWIPCYPTICKRPPLQSYFAKQLWFH